MAKPSRWIAIGFLAGTIVAALVAATWVLGYPDRPRAGEGRAVDVTIEPGVSLAHVSERLEERGVIEHPLLFRLYAHRRDVATELRSGTYALWDDMTPREVLTALVEGVEEPTATVTVPEGFHILEAFERVEAAGIAARDDLEALAQDDAFLRGRGIEGPSAEGYLYPDTYEFHAPSAPEAVLDRMIERHHHVWREVREEHAESLARLRDELEFSDHEFIILASIVEKEAAVARERPRIAQVFVNRLTSSSFQPRLLQTDPTIRYGCQVPLGSLPDGCEGWSVENRLRRAQLDDSDNPYNTYQHEGLPPGPIANPGRTSLEAAVSPDGSDYLYFVSRNDGTHVFSRSHAEHVRAVDRYQRRAQSP